MASQPIHSKLKSLISGLGQIQADAAECAAACLLLWVKQ